MRGKHVVLTLGRSGSNLLVDMLNQNPAVLNVGEVLGDWSPLRRLQRRAGFRWGDDAAWLDAIHDHPVLFRAMCLARNLRKRRAGKRQDIKAATGIASVGFKEFQINFRNHGLDTYLAERPEVRVIGLTRRNVIDRMVSVAILEASGPVKISRSQGAAPRRIMLPPAEVIPRLDVIARETDALDAALRRIGTNRVYRLDYEDFLRSPDHSIAHLLAIYRHIGVPDYIPQIRQYKILPEDPLDGLANGEEVREIIARSFYARWLKVEDGVLVDA